MNRIERTLGVVVALCALLFASTGAHVPAYQRTAWKHWIDVDRDCQNTRDEALIAESLVPVTFADARGCRVASGRWEDLYSGEIYTSPTELDVDHMVPLQWAHQHGGWAWSPPIKAEFANELEYPAHLVVVHRSLNRAKGAKGPEAWVPPDVARHCAYGRAWIAIVERWGLTVTWHEVKAMQRLVDRCE